MIAKLLLCLICINFHLLLVENAQPVTWTITEFEQPTAVKKLELHGAGRLLKIKTGYLKSLSNLTELSLSGNRLKSLPHGELSLLDKLEVLDLSENPWICDSDFKVNVLDPIRQLLQLAAETDRNFTLRNADSTECSFPRQLVNYRILNVPDEDLINPYSEAAGCEVYRHDYRYAPLVSVGCEPTESDVNLTSAVNQLQTADQLIDLKVVVHKFTTMHLHLDNLSNLRRLTIGGNGIRFLTNADLNLPQITHFQIDYMYNLRSIDPDLFDSLKNLTHLVVEDMSSEAIPYLLKALQSPSMNRLKSVDLSDLPKLKANQFPALISLKTLKLRDVRSIDAGAFDGLKSLKTLKLRDVRSIDAGMFNGLENISHLVLETSLRESAELPRSLFEPLKNLEKLVVVRSRSSLQNFNAELLGMSDTIVELDISSEKWSIGAEALSALRNLEKLSLRGMEPSSPHEFVGLSKLDSLIIELFVEL